MQADDWLWPLLKGRNGREEKVADFPLCVYVNSNITTSLNVHNGTEMTECLPFFEPFSVMTNGCTHCMLRLDQMQIYSMTQAVFCDFCSYFEVHSDAPLVDRT